MASLAQQFGGLKCPPISTVENNKFSTSKKHYYTVLPSKRSVVSAAAVAITNAQTRERMKLKEMFEEAYERCRTNPLEGVAFTVEDFHDAIEKYDFNSEIGTKVRWVSAFISFPFSGLV